MLETSLITVIYKRIGKFWYITQSELTVVYLIAKYYEMFAFSPPPFIRPIK
jgi:hypothetical protein